MPREQYTIHYIYKTTNIITRKFYVGMHSTFDMNDDYIGSGKRLWYSIKKYGKENHKREILEFCKNRTELKKREEVIINEDMIHDKMCMNLMKGGQGGFISAEQQKRRSIAGAKAFKNKLKNDKEFRNYWSKKSSETMKDLHSNGKIKYDTFTGKKHKLKTIEKMKMSHSGKHVGKLNSQFGTIWITNEIENKKIKKDDLIPKGWKKGRIMVRGAA